LAAVTLQRATSRGRTGSQSAGGTLKLGGSTFPILSPSWSHGAGVKTDPTGPNRLPNLVGTKLETDEIVITMRGDAATDEQIEALFKASAAGEQGFETATLQLDLQSGRRALPASSVEL